MNIGYTLPGAEENIIIGRKIHTFRGDPKNRWKAGRKIHHHKGRYKTYRCFLQNECRATQRVRMTLSIKSPSRLHVRVDGRRVNDQVIRAMAVNDGFNNLHDFIRWFFPVSKDGEVKARTWKGVIIHWTNLIY